mmetsp:Transcript_36308/g.102595  ORF Transcript_36308/g.102595 Transcript_36308/m.102595 type:complete len:266 (+) Transcript_36308:389-1186(+)
MEKGGLNVQSIQDFRKYFDGLSGPGTAPAWGSPWPKQYTQLERPDGPLPFPTVRLVVIPLEDSPSLVSAAAAATREVVSALPPGDMFLNARNSYHVTLFHTSGLFDPVTDPLQFDGGLPAGLAPCDRPCSSLVTLEAERERVESLAARTAAPQLEVDRVVFADSGVLLLLLLEVETNSVVEIRRNAREVLPGMPAKVPSIIHVSLMRYLSPARLSPEQIQRLQYVCKKWTDQMRGKRFTPSNLWYVQEKEFSTIAGNRVVMPFNR